MTKRFRKYVEYIFTFLDYTNVPFENNFAERQIRPAVILRKNSQSNRSDRGAAIQAILMSVYRTLKLRGLNPTRTACRPAVGGCTVFGPPTDWGRFALSVFFSTFS